MIYFIQIRNLTDYEKSRYVSDDIETAVVKFDELMQEASEIMDSINGYQNKMYYHNRKSIDIWIEELDVESYLYFANEYFEIQVERMELI